MGLHQISLFPSEVWEHLNCAEHSYRNEEDKVSTLRKLRFPQGIGEVWPMGGGQGGGVGTVRK